MDISGLPVSQEIVKDNARGLFSLNDCSLNS